MSETKKAEFDSIVSGQFPDTEEEALATVDEVNIEAAKQSFRDFLSGKTENEYLEADFVRLYMELLKACGFNEDLAAKMFLEVIDGEA